MKIKRKNRRPPIDRVLLPFRSFAHKSSSAGVLLLLCAVVAIFLANSQWASLYHKFWHLPLSIGIGDFSLSYSLHHWINDGLMALFFFVVGLEIKREVLAGELKSIRQSLLPIVAAFGGMVVPAAFYLFLNFGEQGSAGWGIPMATDIAFTLGVLTLIGSRVPISLKVFLTALAIVDDIGAVLVIALFYTSDIAVVEILIAFCFLAALFTANLLGVRSTLVYAILGIGGLWLAFLLSGIHPSIAGVLAAFTIPARKKIAIEQFCSKTGPLISRLSKQPTLQSEVDNLQEGEFLDAERLTSLLKLRQACEEATAPAQRLEKVLHPWVVFGIMPLFALANAGVTIEGEIISVLLHPVALGIIFGLFLGKQVGIFTFSYLTVKLGFAELPRGVTFRHIYGASSLAGIGFTMSLFIAGLAFPTSPQLLMVAKVGIMGASILSGIVGYVILRYFTDPVTNSNSELGVRPVYQEALS